MYFWRLYARLPRRCRSLVSQEVGTGGLGRQYALHCDLVGFWPPSNLPIPGSSGGFFVCIPWKWYADGGAKPLRDWMDVPQTTMIMSNGTVKVSKGGIAVLRTLEGANLWMRE